MRRALWLWLFTAHCGDSLPASVSALVRIDGLLKDEVAALDLYAMGPERDDEVLLTCPSLLRGDMAPLDDRVDLLAQTHVVFSEPEGRSVVIENVATGIDRLVYVEARDAGDVVLGHGCAEGIEVKAGATVEVTVDVFRK
ncbi:MAG: hypothetical protein HYZ27_02935 [Deltaproteobacteria bacterium]|nr:hypothetical protein [Deltaproteobacteria bacterium]